MCMFWEIYYVCVFIDCYNVLAQWLSLTTSRAVQGECERESNVLPTAFIAPNASHSIAGNKHDIFPKPGDAHLVKEITDKVPNRVGVPEFWIILYRVNTSMLTPTGGIVEKMPLSAQVKPCRLLGVKPLSEAMLTYHQLDHPEQISVHCETKCK